MPSGPAGLALIVIFAIFAVFVGTRLGYCWIILEERYPEFREQVTANAHMCTETTFDCADLLSFALGQRPLSCNS